MHRKATPKGQMSSSGMGPAIAHLPMHLKVLFEPRPPLDYKPLLVKRKMPQYAGISAFIQEFEKTKPPQRIVDETPKERHERTHKEKQMKADEEMAKLAELWDPHAKNENATEDAYKTLFVGRLSYDAPESLLRQELERYGAIKKICMIQDKEGKPRGYAFVEFEKEEDMKAAFKRADAKKIDGRRIVVDVERGRTVRDWKPRKLGGGIGDSRKGDQSVNVKYSGREAISSSSRRDSYREDGSRDGGGGGYGGSRYGDSSDRGGGGYPRDDYRRRGSDRDREYGGRGVDRDDAGRGSGGGGGVDREDRGRSSGGGGVDRDRRGDSTTRHRSRSRDREYSRSRKYGDSDDRSRDRSDRR